ncbi:MAG: CPBP family intramembrane metalloprotease [Alphaproteobacteria bacterium]|nr:CPBP family intramembrane metalloprotease [Alphaproteobacteria bacterium]
MTSKAKKPAISPPGLLIICVLILMAGWIKLLFPTWLEYSVDYAERMLIIAMTLAYGGFRFRVANSALEIRTLALTVSILMVSLVAHFIEQATWKDVPVLGGQIWPYSAIQFEPHIYFDLTVGLMLVAVSEELVFRYLIVRVFPGKTTLQYLVTFMAFGLIHAPQGLYGMAFAGIIGMLFMWLYKRTKTLSAPIAAHYLYDLYFFSTVYYGHLL